MSILVVDSDPMSRKMLGFLLESEGFKAVMAETIREARFKLLNEIPQLILLETSLPDGDGLGFCQNLVKDEPDIPVIILSSQVAQADKLAGFRHGADDYVVKPYDPSELVERIKAVLRRSSRVQPHLSHKHLQVGGLELFPSDLRIRKDGTKFITLTPTEMKILSCLMLNVGQVVSRASIAEAALGMDYDSCSNAIDVYVARLRKKIETDPAQPKYIETVVGSGYRMPKSKNKAKFESFVA
jgi:DNA-binding response OmpR family regulator